MQNSKKNVGFNFLKIIPAIAIIILVLTMLMINSMKNQIAENKLNDNDANIETVENEDEATIESENNIGSENFAENDI